MAKGNKETKKPKADSSKAKTSGSTYQQSQGKGSQEVKPGGKKS